MHYDVIVLGCGGMGSAAAWHLARRGQRVLVLERFDIPNRMGSSHGFNRIIRLAYYEHPLYVPLLRRAYHNWREAEAAAGEQLLFVTGSLDAGPAGSHVVEGSITSCLTHGIPHELLDAGQIMRRFPGWQLPPHFAALYQPEGGFIASERAIVAHTLLAQSAGAEVRAREAVLGLEATANGVRVRSERATYTADRAILAVGAWTGGLLPELQPHAVPERQVLGWFQPQTPALFARDRFPVFNLLGDAASGDDGRWYGFPVWGMPGMKLGRYHHMGETVDPDGDWRTPQPRDEAILREALRRYFPDADGPVMGLAACAFTNTQDEHFIIDRLPQAPQIVVASPCSGHGYKFCSVIGEILADLAMARAPGFDLSPFALRRLGAP